MSSYSDGVPRLTREQAAIIGAYTGVVVGDFADVHEYIESLMGRPVWTHELANLGLIEEIKDKARPDFLAIAVEGSIKG